MSRFSICLCWYTRLSHNNTGGCARIPLYVCVSVCKCVCMLFYICDLRDVPRDSLNMSRGISASPQVRFLSWKLVTVFVLINMSRGISASPQVWHSTPQGSGYDIPRSLLLHILCDFPNVHPKKFWLEPRGSSPEHGPTTHPKPPSGKTRGREGGKTLFLSPLAPQPKQKNQKKKKQLRFMV